MYLRIKLALAAVALSTVAVGQINFTNSPTDGPFQVRYFANTALGESVVDFTNTGANGTADICVNTYTFAPDEQLVSCCSCRVTRNALWSLAVKGDLLSNTLTNGAVTSGVIKLLATAPVGSGPTSCDAAAPGALVQGMAAWGTTLHPVTAAPAYTALTETPFTNSTLSTAELNIMAGYCNFIHLNGSKYGICRSCDLGASKEGVNPASQTGTNATPEQNKGLGADKQ